MFPSWEKRALSDVLASCYTTGSGDKVLATAVELIFEWSDMDLKSTITTSSAPASSASSAGPGPIKERIAYDKLLRMHLLRHETPESRKLTLKAAVMFHARARLAKKVLEKRRVEVGCVSAVAHESKSEKVSSADYVLMRQMSREEKIEEGVRLVQQRLKFLHIRMLEMKDDGNCQFRAISYELYGTQEHHEYVRIRVVSHLKQHEQDFSFFVGDDYEWGAYLGKMGCLRCWGDELTLTAAAQAFDVNIHVVSTEEANWLLHYGDKDRYETSRHLFLAYISPIHYNVVAPLPSSAVIIRDASTGSL